MYAASIGVQAWSLMQDYLQECVGTDSTFIFFLQSLPQCLSCVPGSRGEEEEKPLCLSLPLVGSVFSHNAGGIVLHCDFLAH